MKRERLRVIMDILLCVLCIAFVCAIVGNRIYLVLNHNAPREFRELNSIYFAFELAKGNNPYSEVLMTQNNPIVTNMYGFLASLLWAPFLMILSESGLSYLQICELISIATELIGALFIYRIIKIKTESFAYGVLASLFLYACYWRYTSFAGAYPDQLGIVFSLFVILTITCDECRNKYRPWVYAIQCIVLFYIKQYFVVMAPAILVYFLIRREWKSAGRFTLVGCAVGILSIVGINYVFPLYFAEILPIAQGQTPSAGWGYSLRQLVTLVRSPFLLFSSAIVAGVIIRIFTRTREDATENFGRVSIELVVALVALPVTIFIAKNDGTYYTYYLQILFPYVIILGCENLKMITDYVCVNKRKKGYKIVFNIMFVLLLAKSLQYLSSYTLMDRINPEQQIVWNETYSFVNGKFKEGDVYLPACVGLPALEHNRYSYDYGQAEFNSQYNYDNWTHSKLWTTLFPKTGDILNKNLEYDEIVLRRCEAGEWSCLLTLENSNIDRLLSTGQYDYIMNQTKMLKTGNQEWTIHFWIRK